MKKTYWWRFLVLTCGVSIFCYSWVASYGNKLGLCKTINKVRDCIINYNSFVDALAFYSVSLIVISLFLFFITDKIFLKWLRFAAIWVILSIILIALTPEYPSGGIMSGPDREMVSIWLGGLFVVVSLGKIVWDVVKERKLK